MLAIAAAYSHILFPATAGGKNVAPRVAAKLDVAQISDITKVEAADTFERPIYAGNALVTVQTSDATKVLTVQPTAFKPQGEGTALKMRLRFPSAEERDAALAYRIVLANDHALTAPLPITVAALVSLLSRTALSDPARVGQTDPEFCAFEVAGSAAAGGSSRGRPNGSEVDWETLIA